VDELDALLERARVEEVEGLEVADELEVGFGQRRVVDRLALRGCVGEADLLGEDRLAGPRTPREDHERPGGQPAAEDKVELGDAGGQMLQVSLRFRRESAPPRRPPPARRACPRLRPRRQLPPADWR
jgi:hypothetical protein